jgi:putative transposase
MDSGCDSLWLKVAMSDVFMLSRTQLNRMEQYFPTPHGVKRVDDRRVISGIIYVIKNGLRWKDAPAVYGPHKTLYNRFVRWSRAGIFNVIFRELAKSADPRQGPMIDATHLKAHRTAASRLKKGRFPGVLAARKAA